ncbi:zn-ribbon containing protein [Halogeometricum pallidum JCM 14848]|uniref:Zn-ribbon containing protein n=1 Tax=Halogeometricum pallidum JCM 14848 TaxID=1227487 RepID=M0D8N6_HALPD|nr:zn-ribbon containing protein [Halogeometricum pallidum JCM 14848]
MFADGSKEMLSGCPNCGGNKFQFSPSKGGRDDAAETTGRREASSSDATASSDTTTSHTTGASDATTSDSAPRSPDSTPSSGQTADATDAEPADETSGSNTWRRAASRAADAESDPDADGETRTRSDRADGVDAARRRGQSLREWANSRGFASEVEDAKDETTLRENRRQTGDAQRLPPERRSSTEAPDSSQPSDPVDSAGASDAGDPSRPVDETSFSTASEPPTASKSSTDPEDRPAERPSEPAERPSEQTERPSDSTETPDSSTGRAAPDEDGTEDDAQASARSDVVSPDEIRAASEETPPTDANGRVIEPQSDDRPNLDELREELNEQFESIKIVAPGEYELNLMELYDRPEYIISLREDGRYVIEVPDTWGPRDDDDR